MLLNLIPIMQEMDYQTFAEKAALQSIEVVKEFIERSAELEA